MQHASRKTCALLVARHLSVLMKYGISRCRGLREEVGAYVKSENGLSPGEHFELS